MVEGLGRLSGQGKFYGGETGGSVQQPVHVEFRLRSDVHFGVGYGGHCELHGETRGITQWQHCPLL